jgi:hypothetical protein
MEDPQLHANSQPSTNASENPSPFAAFSSPSYFQRSGRGFVVVLPFTVRRRLFTSPVYLSNWMPYACARWVLTQLDMLIERRSSFLSIASSREPFHMQWNAQYLYCFGNWLMGRRSDVVAIVWFKSFIKLCEVWIWGIFFDFLKRIQEDLRLLQYILNYA